MNVIAVLIPLAAVLATIWILVLLVHQSRQEVNYQRARKLRIGAEAMYLLGDEAKAEEYMQRAAKLDPS